MSSGVQHCPFCGGRLRLVKVINVDTTRKSDFLANNNASTQELMCASCGSRVAVGQKLPTSNSIANTETAGAPAAASSQAQKQKSMKSDYRATFMLLLGIALLSVLAYFTYKNSDVLLDYWDRLVAFIQNGLGSLKK